MLFGLAKRIKEAWEWWGIVSSLPVTAVGVAVYRGVPLDVVLLYLMAAIAYFVVIVSEYPAVGEFVFARKRSALKRRLDTLGRFLIEGQDLAHKLAGGYRAERVTSLDLLEEIDVAWARKVEGYLQSDRVLGSSYVARFRQDAIFPGGLVAIGNIPRYISDWENAVTARCRKLEAFITELSDTHHTS